MLYYTDSLRNPKSACLYSLLVYIPFYPNVTPCHTHLVQKRKKRKFQIGPRMISKTCIPELPEQGTCLPSRGYSPAPCEVGTCSSSSHASSCAVML
ncbi:hypothetical protein P168DRAFT_177902 [Aspergillus campestris IBT 28561]|uniref:Uncharacterized protein n=1 Tax=Aspergillus campestris (strain IBT 28561) TaxID=1392248 RepID=A0A2I1CZU2_ASPC2|nr:uncharacterized protein P168DRAFT_177902 [Aspergillus campestris IBT 28561]PKY03138.1 hypothetical protein P168DRAFT_177902 [Aspergillus campestris IBT 28561]